MLKKLGLSAAALAAASASFVSVAPAHASVSDPSVNYSRMNCMASSSTTASSRSSVTVSGVDNTKNYTIDFKMSDGSGVSSVVNTDFINDGDISSAIEYKGNIVPVSATVKEYDSTGALTDTIVISPNNKSCNVPIKAPTASQVVVSGLANDTVTIGEKSYPQTGGFGGVRWDTSTNKMIVNYADNGQPFVFPDGTITNGAQYTFTDNGEEATTTVTKPVTKTTSVPVYSNITTCNNPVVGTFQVDLYLPYHKGGTWLNGKLLTKNVPLTAAELNTRMKLDDDNKLLYREDKPLWGADATKFVTITLNDVKAAGSLNAALQTKSGWAITANQTTPLAGSSVAKAWKLGNGATAALPWSSTHLINQTDYDAVVLPTATCSTKSVQTGTKVDTTTTNVTTTVAATPPTYTVTPGNTGGVS